MTIKDALAEFQNSLSWISDKDNYQRVLSAYTTLWSHFKYQPQPQAGGCEGEYRRFTVHYMPRTSVDKLPWGILDSETSTTEHVSTREAALKAANEMEEWYKKYTKSTEEATNES